MRAATGTFLTLLHRHHALKTSGSTASLSSHAKQAQLTLSNVLNKFRGTVLEAMSKTLPEKDRVWLAERWGFVQPIRESRAEALQSAGTAAHKNATASTHSSHQNTIQLELGEGSSQTESLLHPMFGELLADFGYKKVYSTSIQQLIKIPVWEKQRILRPARAQKIAREWMRRDRLSAHGARLPGLITLFTHSDTNTAGIVDGQHRVGAIMIMAEQGVWDLTSRNILVDVFETSTESDICDLFTDINSAEPVKLVDMPGQGADDQIKDMLEGVAQALEKKYPDMFKSSQRCRPPHLNTDNLRDDIFQSSVVSRHALTSSVQLLGWLELQNEMLATRDDAQWEAFANERAMGKSFLQALKKARDHGLFLGLDKSWLSV